MHGGRFIGRISLILVVGAAAATGCSTSPPAPVSDALRGGDEDRAGGATEVTRALYQQFRRWSGTRYRYGGAGPRGMDCSGLIQVVYRDAFDRRLPRTTDAQSDIGRAVSRRNLAPGDLVFFKTGLFQRHVGIYVDDGLFLHASQSDGVRLSSMNEGYWRKRFWQGRRLDVRLTGI